MECEFSSLPQDCPARDTVAHALRPLLGKEGGIQDGHGHFNPRRRFNASMTTLDGLNGQMPADAWGLVLAWKDRFREFKEEEAWAPSAFPFNQEQVDHCLAMDAIASVIRVLRDDPFARANPSAVAAELDMARRTRWHLSSADPGAVSSEELAARLRAARKDLKTLAEKVASTYRSGKWTGPRGERFARSLVSAVTGAQEGTWVACQRQEALAYEERDDGSGGMPGALGLESETPTDADAARL